MKRLFLMLSLACGSTELAPTDKNVPPDVYDVHEWGLIDQRLSDGALRLSAPSQQAHVAPSAMFGLGIRGYGKPVLYFHVESGKRIELKASVAVTGEMRMVEHWPRTFTNDTEVRWEAELVPDPCSEPRTYPTTLQPFCTRMPDGICETAELPEYETDDASCLIVDGTQWPLLLYRAAPVEESERPEERVELPLEVEVDPNGTVRIRNRSQVTSPLPMFRLTQRPTGTHATRLDWPAPGEAVSIPRVVEGQSDDGSRDAMREAASSQGLNESEVDAFFRAWEEELWGPEPTAEAGGETGSLGLRGYGRGGGGVGGRPIGLGGLGTTGRMGIPGMGYDPRTRDVLIYWLPESVIDELAPLSFEPPPRNVERAMMVRVSLL